jgi:hypothetical protein
MVGASNPHAWQMFTNENGHSVSSLRNHAAASVKRTRRMPRSAPMVAR